MSFIILDRDGVINFESVDYIKSPEELHFIPGSLEAIAALHQASYQVIVATNQSGIARGLYDFAMLEKIHAKLFQAAEAAGGKITDLFFCPHHPKEGCPCRKPKPGMFNQIREKYALHFGEVYFIGDSVCDMKTAEVVGCKPLLVLTGNGQKTLAAYSGEFPAPYFPDLKQAVEYVLNDK